MSALTESGRQKSTIKQLTNPTFFARIIARLNRDLPATLQGFHTRSHSNLLKIFYENVRVHFEVWPLRSRNLIEIGLHFEDGPVSTAAYLHYFDARIVALKDELGADVDLEQWTTSWGHIFYMLPSEPFDSAKADEASARLVKLISTLQPLVEVAAVPPENVERRASTGRYQRRRRTI